MFEKFNISIGTLFRVTKYKFNSINGGFTWNMFFYTKGIKCVKTFFENNYKDTSTVMIYYIPYIKLFKSFKYYIEVGINERKLFPEIEDYKFTTKIPFEAVFIESKVSHVKIWFSNKDEITFLKLIYNTPVHKCRKSYLSIMLGEKFKTAKKVEDKWFIKKTST